MAPTKLDSEPDEHETKQSNLTFDNCFCHRDCIEAALKRLVVESQASRSQACAEWLVATWEIEGFVPGNGMRDLSKTLSHERTR